MTAPRGRYSTTRLVLCEPVEQVRTCYTYAVALASKSSVAGAAANSFPPMANPSLLVISTVLIYPKHKGGLDY